MQAGLCSSRLGGAPGLRRGRRWVSLGIWGEKLGTEPALRKLWCLDVSSGVAPACPTSQEGPDLQLIKHAKNTGINMKECRRGVSIPGWSSQPPSSPAQPPQITPAQNTNPGPIWCPTDEHRCVWDFRAGWQPFRPVASCTCCRIFSLLDLIPIPPAAPGTPQGWAGRRRPPQVMTFLTCAHPCHKYGCGSRRGGN